MVDFVARSLVGRSAELEALHAALDSARAGRGGLVAVLGEAGIGKSRLLGELAALAEVAGLAVLLGRAVETSSPVAYRPLAEAILRAVRRRPVDVSELGPFAGVLGRLVPGLGEDADALPDPSPVIVGEAILRLLGSLGAACGAAMLVLEDLQWADPETLAIVEFLADNCREEPVLVAVAIRTGTSSAAGSLMRALSARRIAATVELLPLTQAEVERMAAACLETEEPPPAVVDVLSSRSDGLPLFVEELLLELAKAGVLKRDGSGWTAHAAVEPLVPLSFVEAIERRMAGLDERARVALQAAAVVGSPFDWRLIETLTGANDDETTRALRRGVEAQLLVVDGAEFRFRHALTRDAILATLLPPELARLAARGLDALAAREDIPSASLAELALWAGDQERAVALLIEAGKMASNQGGLASAEAMLERALRLADEGTEACAEAAELLLDVLAFEGRLDRAEHVGNRLLQTLDVIQAPAERVGAARYALARAAATAGVWDEAERQLEIARMLASEAGDDLFGARLGALGARAALESWRLAQAETLASRALGVAEFRDAPELACEALFTLGRRARFLEHREEAEDAFERAGTLAEQRGLRPARLQALVELGTLELFATHRVDRLQEARELAVEIAAVAHVAAIDHYLGIHRLNEFEPRQGLELARRSAETARRFRLGLLPRSLLLEAGLQAQLGCEDEMEALVAEISRLAPDNRDLAAATHGLCRGVLALLREEREQARGELEQAVKMLRALPAASPYPFEGLWTLVDALEGTGTEAFADSAGARKIVKFNSALREYARAIVAGRGGHPEEAEAAFARAEAEMVVFKGHGHLARRLVAEAAIEDSWGEPGAWLRAAVPFFEERGHDRVARACKALLRRAGAPVPRRGRGLSEVPPDLRAQGITSREADVLNLIAEGLSNRQIAEHLFLSPRTVEGYVSSLIAKLNASGRSQLAALSAARRAQIP